jgi:uncharacterized protein YjbI with pentapeptide repeats
MARWRGSIAVANRKHVALLTQGAKVWNAWRNKDATVPNLMGVTLYEVDLRGANLCGASLRKARLIGSNLSRANLTNANLSQADIEGADLRRANWYQPI